MSFDSDKIQVKIQDKIYHFNYSFNEKTSFQEFLEYISSLLPNICCMCHKFYFDKDKNKNKKVDINNADKIYKYIKKNIHNFILNCDKCFCGKELKEYILKTKLDLCKKIKELEKEINNLKKKKI